MTEISKALYSLFGEILEGRKGHKPCNGRGFAIIWTPSERPTADLALCGCVRKYEKMEEVLQETWEKVKMSMEIAENIMMETE